MDKNNWENICQNINGGSFPVGTGLMGGFYFYLWASLKQIGLTYITRKKRPTIICFLKTFLKYKDKKKNPHTSRKKFWLTTK